MNTRVAPIVIGVLIVGLALVGISQFTCVFGSCGPKLTPAERAVTSFETCVSGGFLVTEGSPRKCLTTDGRTFSEKVKAVSSKGASSKAPENISVLTPKDNEKVAKIFLLKGQARTFESVVNYRLKDEDGTVLTEAFTTASAPDVGQFGPFSTSLDTTGAKGKKGTLEVYELSAEDGSEVHKVTVHLQFSK